MSSGKRDKDCFIEDEITSNYNVFLSYNSQSCKPKFYEDHFKEDFDYSESEIAEENVDSYINYLKKNDDELPDNFYQR